MARRKSALDLSIQWGRIFDRLQRGANGRLTPAAQKRYEKAFAAYSKYDSNIRNSKAYTKAYNKAYVRAFENTPAGSTPNRSVVARSAGDMAGITTKVPRSVYMGIAGSKG